MLIGTWNLESYPAPTSRKGRAMRDVLESHGADLWLLTELHSEFHIAEMQMAFCQSRPEAPSNQRKAAIASRLPLLPTNSREHPAEGSLCLARIELPGNAETILIASAVLPWRGSTPYWRSVFGTDLSYAEVYARLLDYVVARIHDERRPGEAVVFGGDFNQGFYGRDYVGTLHGRTSLTHSFDSLGLHVPTMQMPALIEDHPAIDQIAIPHQWNVNVGQSVYRPARGNAYLSDHALYKVEVDFPRKGKVVEVRSSICHCT